MSRFSWLIISFFFLTPVWADMRLEVLDLTQRVVRITYEVQDHKAGNRVFIFPSGGFIHDATAGNFKVESVFDVNAKRELEFTIIKDTQSEYPQIKITYPEPIQTGKSKTLQIAVKVNMPETLLKQDANGRVLFEYETSHKFEFIAPQGHYVVFTSHPVWIFEKGDNLIVQQLDENLRKISIQTRPLE